MAYDAYNLSALAYVNGFTVWHYRTEDKHKEVTKSGYFNGACSVLREHDILVLNLGDGDITSFVTWNRDGKVSISDDLGALIKWCRDLERRLERMERRWNGGA